MPDAPPQPVNLDCPLCGAPIRAEVYSLVDVGLDPELKGKLLRGRINVAHCTSCGSEGIIAAPLMYHDPAKELLLVFIPPETQLSDPDQQRLIGSLTNMIMAYLPPEERKGYLLLPKVLLSYQSLLETILQAEGVTPEMMATQRARMDLLDRLGHAASDEEGLRKLVAEVDGQLDFEFFAVLGAYVESSRQDGQEDRARALEALRERLLELSSYGRKLAAQMLVGPAEEATVGREELLGKLLAASSEEERSELVGRHRSTVDYGFYQMLTEQLEAAEQGGQKEQAQRLHDLRASLLEVTERLDAEAQAALENGTELLRQLLDAADPQALIRQRLAEFDDAFFIVLGANLQIAQQAGREDAYKRLQELGSLVIQIAQEKLPPEVRLIQRLAAAPDDAAVQALLQESASLVSERLVEIMRDLAAEVDNEETAARLRQLADQAEGWLRGQGGVAGGG